MAEPAAVADPRDMASAPPPATADDAGQGLLAAAARKRETLAALEPRSALDGVTPAPRFGAWTVAAGLVLMAGSLWAASITPRPQRIAGIKIAFLPGPQVHEAEVVAWIRRFPQSRHLANPNEWVLHQLAEHLRTWTAVGEVPLVRLVHQKTMVPAIRRDRAGGSHQVQVPALRRMLEVTVGLRQPFLPAVLEDGTRVWLDAEGRVLPGILPRPETPRPVVRGLRAGGTEAIKEVCRLWALLEPRLERGLVTDINLSEAYDPAAPAGGATDRGIVLRTRTGSRILWGSPDEERYGVSADEKAANLVHTLRCQGDLTRLATVNVRFRDPVYTIR